MAQRLEIDDHHSSLLFFVAWTAFGQGGNVQRKLDDGLVLRPPLLFFTFSDLLNDERR